MSTSYDLIRNFSLCTQRSRSSSPALLEVKASPALHPQTMSITLHSVILGSLHPLIYPQYWRSKSFFDHNESKALKYRTNSFVWSDMIHTRNDSKMPSHSYDATNASFTVAELNFSLARTFAALIWSSQFTFHTQV